MAPAVQDDIDINAHKSGLMNGRNSPFYKGLSGAIDPLSHSEASPALLTEHHPRYASYGNYLDTNIDGASHHGLLKDRMAATIHPHIVKISMYDGANDADDEKDNVDADEDLIDHLEQEAGTQDQATFNADDITDGEGDVIAGDIVEFTTKNGAESTVEDGADLTGENGPELTADDGADITADDTAGLAEDDDQENADVDQAALTDGPEAAPTDQPHGFSREQESASIAERVASFWNIHKVDNFSEDYEAEVSDLDSTWENIYRPAKRAKTLSPSAQPNRPNPYEQDTISKGKFLPITPVERFLEQLRDPEIKSHDELYAITANVAHTLKVWQDEYLAIDRLSKLATRQTMKKTANPRQLEDPQVFDDKKESMLYGYKYDAKEAKIGIQDPFVQGGFKPTPAQARKMRASFGPNPANPGNWKPIIKFGVKHVPRFQEPPKELNEPRRTRKRKAAQLGGSASSNEANETAETAPVVETEDEPGAPPRKRQARSRGGKDATAKDEPQRSATPANTAPRRGAASGRDAAGRSAVGRGAAAHATVVRGEVGRDAGRDVSGRGTTGRSIPERSDSPIHGAITRGRAKRGGQAQGLSSSPQPAPVAPTRSSARIPARASQTDVSKAARTVTAPQGRRPSGSRAAAPAIAPASATPPATASAAPRTTSSVPAPVSPQSEVTNPIPIAPATLTSTRTTSSSGDASDGSDAPDSTLARRQKIANSKNPKRTEAMLNHWEKFNREGRTRNPKRTRAQIEADRAAEALRKASETPKPAPKKRKNPEVTSNGESATKKIKAESPAPASIQPAPVQPTPMQATAVKSAPLRSASVRPALIQPSPILPTPLQAYPMPPGPIQPAHMQAPPVQHGPPALPRGAGLPSGHTPPMAPLSIPPSVPPYAPIDPRMMGPHHPYHAPLPLAPNPPPLIRGQEYLAPNAPVMSYSVQGYAEYPTYGGASQLPHHRRE